MSRYVVTVDARLCIGSSNCVEAAPEAYDMDDALAVVREPRAGDDALLEGARACPMSAIVVVDAATGMRVWP